MSAISQAFHKQVKLLLDNQQYSYILVALLVVVPFMTWLAVTIVALITLRKGASIGFKAMTYGLLSFMFVTFLTKWPALPAIAVIFLTFFPCYIAALLLRATAKWEWVAYFMVGLTTLIVLLLNLKTPGFLIDQYHALQNMMKELQGNHVQVTGFFSESSQVIAYLLGIQALTFMISIISTLMIARAVQSNLFYPGGFKREILSFQAHPIMIFPLLLMLYGAYEHMPIAISLLPAWCFYFVAAGLSMLLSSFSTRSPILIFVLLLISMFLLPFVMLPIILSIGILDSFFHFRQRFGKSNTHHHH